MADLLAKRGTTLGTGPIEDLPIPAVNLKNTIKIHFYQKWKTMWNNHTKCKQTKLWFAEPDRNQSRSFKDPRPTWANLSSSSLVTTRDKKH
jgi:hypothetical protein